MHGDTHLSMSPDDRTEQLPRPAAPVHAHHPQNLKEAQTTKRRRGKDLSARAETQDDDAGSYDYDICTVNMKRMRKSFRRRFNVWAKIGAVTPPKTAHR